MKPLPRKEKLLYSTIINLAQMIDILTVPSKSPEERDQKIDMLRASVNSDAVEAFKKMGVDVKDLKKEPAKIAVPPKKKLLVA